MLERRKNMKSPRYSRKNITGVTLVQNSMEPFTLEWGDFSVHSGGDRFTCSF